MKDTYADSTTKTMISQMHKFVAFLTRYRLLNPSNSITNPITIPTITPTHLIFLMGYLEQAGHTTYESISKYCSAVRIWCRSQGRPDPGIDQNTGETDLQYYAYNRAMKRALAQPATKRQPLTLHQLDLLMRQTRFGLVLTPTANTNTRAAILMAFYLMLRISEYTTPTQESHTPGTTASRGDIEFFPNQERPEGFTFTVLKSKTDQFRVGRKLTVYAQPEPNLCPVRAMKYLFHSQPAPASAPLFNFGSKLNPNASRTKFTACFVTLLKAAGIDTNTTKPHSLRSGGATALLAAGVEPYVIQKLGRWASWCFATYTQLTTGVIRASQRAMTLAPRFTQGINLTAVTDKITTEDAGRASRYGGSH